MSARMWFAAVASLVVLGIATVTYADRIGTGDGGSVLWKADAELPVGQEWASSRAAAAGGRQCAPAAPPDEGSPRIRRSADIVAQGQYSYAITAVHGDRCDGERDELGQGNPQRSGFTDRLFQPGDDRYISLQVLLGPNFDVNAKGWRLIAQLHQEGDLGTPALSLNVEDGRFVLFRSDSAVESFNTVPLWSARATNRRWVKFTLHVKFSSDPREGFVELWGNPAGGDLTTLLPKTATATMKRDGSGRTVPDHARIGIFRDSRASFGTETVYYDGLTVATTRDAAEHSAF